ncbi:MAG: hypothetical protein HXO19_11340 [Prevotella shahii]|uniref:YopX family protein n=1 Tax=Hoylesella shahii TaxID=228603 RepID=UPI001CB22CB7|nr:YopX family protein [Hoylesella shahii]MBF1591660.1 hypothetical protein [Hoylesella shahii]
MNREIKFRGKPVRKGGIWMEGIGAYKTYTSEHLVLDAKCNCVEVVYLCQYTGLKDCNGNEIYEGDILTISNNLKAIVIWFNGSFRLKDELSCKATYFDDIGVIMRDYDVCIIGNIYDNPEIIKR